MRHCAGRRQERGFTLIELIVVLVILGLALSLALAQGPARSPAVEFDAALRQVAGTLRLAHSRAIADDRTVSVVFTPRGFRLDRDPITAFPADISLSGSQLINFTPDGGSSGGQIALRMDNRQMTIDVDWLTGRVTLSQSG